MSLSANYFDLFEIPVSFNINTDTLAQRYRELQRTVHPDKYASAPERERRLAMQNATQINEAFQTLKNPLTRARYLLQLQGVDTNEESDTAMDSEFLMAQMELREELADIKQKSQPVDALETFLTRVKQKQQRLIDALSQQFAQKKYQSARETVRQFQFFVRLHEEALRVEEELV
jgi:molecular chaperone HscB